VPNGEAGDHPAERVRGDMSSVFGNLTGAAFPSRRLAGAVRNAFGAIACAADMLVIIAAAGAPALLYHSLAYENVDGAVNSLAVGVAAASIFALPNVFRREYVLAKYFSCKEHARRSLALWHLTFLCLLALGFLTKVTDVYSRGAASCSTPRVSPHSSLCAMPWCAP